MTAAERTNRALARFQHAVDAVMAHAPSKRPPQLGARVMRAWDSYRYAWTAEHFGGEHAHVERRLRAIERAFAELAANRKAKR